MAGPLLDGSNVRHRPDWAAPTADLPTTGPDALGIADKLGFPAHSAAQTCAVPIRAEVWAVKRRGTWACVVSCD